MAIEPLFLITADWPIVCVNPSDLTLVPEDWATLIMEELLRVHGTTNPNFYPERKAPLGGELVIKFHLHSDRLTFQDLVV